MGANIMTCRAVVLNELRLQQEIVREIHVPHAAVTRLLSAGLNTFYEVDRRARREAECHETVEAQVARDWVDLAG